METFLISIAPELITLLGVVISGLATWGIMLLKRKVKIEAGISALDTVDTVIDAVVGNLAQTVAKKVRKDAKDGHLPKAKRVELKLKAMTEAKALISAEIRKAAQKSVSNLNEYISKQIEDSVLASKK